MRYNIDILYLCDKKKGCHGCDEGYCDHTLYPEHAKNKDSVEVARAFFEKFKPVYGPEDHIVGYEEVEV